MKKLYFIRHGLSEMNVQGVFAGHSETPLTTEGKNQAAKAGKAAKSLDIDLIVCSPLSRAHDTAKIIAKEIGYSPEDIQVNPTLIERFFGDLEGMPYHPDINMDGIADIETDDVLLVRAQQALKWINSFDSKHNILVVSHGAIGRAIRSLIKDEFPINHEERIPNAEIVCWVEG